MLVSPCNVISLSHFVIHLKRDAPFFPRRSAVSPCSLISLTHFVIHLKRRLMVCPFYLAGGVSFRKFVPLFSVVPSSSCTGVQDNVDAVMRPPRRGQIKAFFFCLGVDIGEFSLSIVEVCRLILSLVPQL